MTKHQRIILFGGTFDPIHLGHIEVAEYAFGRIGGDQLMFIPAKRSPLKKFFPKASDDDRYTMISLAVAEKESFDVSDIEIKRQTPSFTIDTVRYFQSIFGPNSNIYWLIGADAVDDLAKWYKIEELIDICFVSVMYRGGFEKPSFDSYIDQWGKDRVAKLENHVIDTPLIDISSTEIREKISTGIDVSQLLHPAVAEFIKIKGLYREK